MTQTKVQLLDLNGLEAVLDADADTTITADTDDQIDFKTAGEDSFIMANGGILTLLNGTTPTINLQDGTTTKGQVLIDSFDQFKIYNKIDDDLILGTNDAGRLTIKNDGKFATGGEGSPDVDAGGITLDHNAEDGRIITGKSSDVSHPFTGFMEADTYFAVQKYSATNGGVRMFGLSEDDPGFILRGIATSSSGSVNSSTNAMVHIDGARSDSGTSATAIGNDNLVMITNNNSGRVVFTGNGNIYSDASSTVSTFDHFDDAQLVRAWDLTHKEGVIDSKFDKFVKYNHEKLAELELVGREDDGTPNMFVNVTGFQKLHNGAIWQQYEKHQKLANAVYELAKAAVGEDKANEILEQNDITLLN